jgi:hypothetical protein
MPSRLSTTLALIALWAGPALSDPAPSPPDLDCHLSFKALQDWAAWLPGVTRQPGKNGEVFTVSDPDVWRVEMTFTKPGDVAHPAVVLRKFVKQVTGVWTAQSKACGYGDQSQLSELLTEIRAADKALTDASRAEVEQKKKELSPLGSP